MGKTVCVDFDGVLNTYTGWKGDDELFEPRPLASEFLRSLKSLGYLVVIHSTRPPSKLMDWFKKHGMEDLIGGISNTKPPAICYVDDRAVLFTGDFGDALRRVENFKAFWENKDNHGL